jgi:hypothetical protein
VSYIKGRTKPAFPEVVAASPQGDVYLLPEGTPQKWAENKYSELILFLKCHITLQEYNLTVKVLDVYH